mgnify:CR=1 FL=1
MAIFLDRFCRNKRVLAEILEESGYGVLIGEDPFSLPMAGAKIDLKGRRTDLFTKQNLQ